MENINTRPPPGGGFHFMEQQLIPHLFRIEYSKIVSVLCKHFGLDQIGIAEDLASDTFLSAVQTWPLKGIPENPTAWLYHVAKNKARNFLQRERLFKTSIAPAINNSASRFDQQEIDLSPQNISDSQLQMMFALCHPSIPVEAQIGLSLRILCGFGVEEIADAFLVSKETINKRMFRARERLREEAITIRLPDDLDVEHRLPAVLTTLYLLFNEGYYSVSQNETLRKDLCLEAMRLCNMLIENPVTNKPAVNALMSLMCFHASRFEARVNKNGELVLYEDQDTSLWNLGLIRQGTYFFHCSAAGKNLSAYHLEAGIAYWNTKKEDTAEKWENILQLYNQLLQFAYSPIVALNRTYALAKANGKQQAIAEAEKLRLHSNQFYHALLGELYTGIDNDKAKEYFQTAVSLAKTPADKSALQKKIDRV